MARIPDYREKSATTGGKPKVAGEVWLAERKRRDRVNAIEASRGCIALAALIEVDDVNFEIPVTDTAVMWSVMRDIRVGHFHPTREAILVNTAHTTLKLGMPFIDFTDATGRVDFNICPVTDDADLLGVENRGDVLHSEDDDRLFHIFNTKNALMTDFAMTAKDVNGKPWRPAWFKANYDAVTLERVPPHVWSPEPLMRFPKLAVGHLFDLANEIASSEESFDCRNCGSYPTRKMFETFRNLGYDNTKSKEYFTAKCPVCWAEQRWYAVNAVASHVVREFLIPFQQKFLRAMTAGLPVLAVGGIIYAGRRPFRREKDFPNLDNADLRHLDLVPHRLISRIDAEEQIVYLPATAKVLVKQGSAVSAGVPWARISDPIQLPPTRVDAWKILPNVLEACGLPRGYLPLLQQIFFESQARRNPKQPDSVFYPSDLVASAAKSIEGTGLYWDFIKAEKYFDKASNRFHLPAHPVAKVERIYLHSPTRRGRERRNQGSTISRARFRSHKSSSELRAPQSLCRASRRDSRRCMLKWHSPSRSVLHQSELENRDIQLFQQRRIMQKKTEISREMFLEFFVCL